MIPLERGEAYFEYSHAGPCALPEVRCKAPWSALCLSTRVRLVQIRHRIYHDGWVCGSQYFLLFFGLTWIFVPFSDLCWFKTFQELLSHYWGLCQFSDPSNIVSGPWGFWRQPSEELLLTISFHYSPPMPGYRMQHRTKHRASPGNLQRPLTPTSASHLYVPSQGGKIKLNEDCNFTKFSILKRRKNIP